MSVCLFALIFGFARFETRLSVERDGDAKARIGRQLGGISLGARVRRVRETRRRPGRFPLSRVDANEGDKENVIYVVTVICFNVFSRATSADPIQGSDDKVLD